jgi:beta-mannanase
MNQAAFWWGGRPGPNGSAKLYKITYDYLMKVKGMTNLIWVWNLQDFANLASDVNTYDPGSEYYDVVSLDVYWSDGTGLTQAKYNIMANKAGTKPLGLAESDVMYTSGDFTAQPKWSYFMCWRELTQQKNSNQRISEIYNSPNVVTLDRMPGWN